MKHQNKTLYTKARSKMNTNVRNAFKNEEGVIDLASIMVGIIVIGLIGGVIAATVFTVIPWTQDNAAKSQLEAIHTAQNAHFGLSADPKKQSTCWHCHQFLRKLSETCSSRIVKHRWRLLL